MILITGGAGFVGSNLVRELEDVRILDNLFLGKKQHLDGVDAEFMKGDVLNEEDVKKALKDVDTVFHLAAHSSSPMFVNDCRGSIKVNTLGFLNVLEMSRKMGVKRVIYASTSTIYGNNQIPYKEDMHVTAPNFYAASKLACENYADVYSKEYGIETVGLRLFSVYGPREEQKKEFANLASQFIWDMLKEKQPIVYDDGNQTRDFVYVKDVVRAFILASKAKGVDGEVFNVGGGVPWKVNDMINLLNELLGTNINPKYVDNPVSGYLYSHKADTSKAENVLGFKSEYTLKQGLKECVDYYKKII
ncbi:NAD-dependent epimerase/dehydratase family protein [Candidatus Woesearchaeota archaeon]|nr:NAD-dependent epimerase/dehydratase family protein [Candidatus Woesearchaeota archaeon]